MAIKRYFKKGGYMNCELCNKDVNQLATMWGKRLCNYCLGANYPRILSEHTQEIKKLKGKSPEKIIKYEISKDGKGLLAYWADGFYHIHSNELTKLEKWILANLVYLSVLTPKKVKGVKQCQSEKVL